jgi:methylenetetrahydrofolate reductase (NADPH)
MSTGTADTADRAGTGRAACATATDGTAVMSRREAMAGALQTASYEVLPFASTVDTVLAHVPHDVRLTVTTTEAKGLGPTVAIACRLAEHGYNASPHLAARLVRDGAHLQDLLDQLGEAGVDGVFAIGGDAPVAAGPYPDALSLLESVPFQSHRFTRVGIGAYPEGHASLDPAQLERALLDKAPHATFLVTQLCFRAATTVTWAERTLASGVHVPVMVGLPGVVSRQKLVRIAGGLGLGPSARFLRKQSNLLRRFFVPGGYSPDRLLGQLADHLDTPDSRLHGFHLFTFNEVAATEAWRQAWLARLT